MINIFDVERHIAPIRKKIMLLVGRCILAAVNNSEKTQKIQIKGLKGETGTDIERYQEYGFETYPKKDCEVLTLFINGNRDQGVVACVHNRETRPKDLNEGDVCVYDCNGNRVWLKSDGILIKDKNGNEVKMEVTGITLKTGDATGWLPNILPNDPFTGMVHGGPLAGIVKLKGA